MKFPIFSTYRTFGTSQSQCRNGGFLIIEVAIACLILVSIGMLFQQQLQQAYYTASDTERRMGVRLVMANYLERLYLENTRSIPEIYEEKCVLCHCCTQELYGTSGEVMKHCCLVEIKSTWKTVTGQKKEEILISAILVDLPSLN